MKKLYYLDESEKHRILELHKKRTNQQYLTEDLPFVEKEGLKYAEPGKWTEIAYDEFYSFLYQNKGNRGKFMKGIRKFCSDSILNKDLGIPTLKKAALTRVVTDIGAILNASSGGGGWGVGLKEAEITQMQNRLKQLENMPNFCHALQLKDTNRGGEDLVDMMNEIYKDVWFFKVVATIEELAENTKKSGETSPDDKKKDDDAKWKQYYPCFEPQKHRLQNVPNRPDLKLGNMIRVKVSDSKSPLVIDGKPSPGARGEKDRTIDAYFFLDGGYVLLHEAESKDYSGSFMCRQQRFTADSDIVIFPGRAPSDDGKGSTESKWTCSAPIPAASTTYPCVESPSGEYSTKEECESKSKNCKAKTGGGGGGGGGGAVVSNTLCYTWGCVTKKVNNELGGVNQQTINDMANKLGIK